MKALALFTMLFVVCIQAVGQDIPKTTAWRSPTIPCGASLTYGGVDLMPFGSGNDYQLPRAVTGAGPVPPANFGIKKVCLTHHITGSWNESYAVAGKGGKNGDYMVPLFTGSGTMCMDWNPPNPFDSSLGEFLDVHASCQGSSHWVNIMVMWVPATPGLKTAIETVPATPKYQYKGEWVIVLNGTRQGDNVTVRFPNGVEAIANVKDLQ